MATIYGTKFADNLSGTSGSDRIYGYGGDDTIFAWNNASGSRDVVAGGDGNDSIEGDGANGQKFYGGNGDDEIYNFATGQGDGGNSYYDGGAGNDRIGGNGEAHGGAGNDTIFAYNGDGASLYGDAGNDNLSGSNYLNGGTGNDTLQYSAYNADGTTTMIGGTGRDRFSIDIIDKERITITDFKHSEGDTVRLTQSMWDGITDDGGTIGLRSSADMFAAYGADSRGRHDGVIRIGDQYTDHSANGSLILRLNGSLITFDHVQQLTIADWAF